MDSICVKTNTCIFAVYGRGIGFAKISLQVWSGICSDDSNLIPKFVGSVVKFVQLVHLVLDSLQGEKLVFTC